jgi:hypothetical protein
MYGVDGFEHPQRSVKALITMERLMIEHCEGIMKLIQWFASLIGWYTREREWRNFRRFVDRAFLEGDRDLLAEALWGDIDVSAHVRERICLMLFLPEIETPPGWLRFQDIFSYRPWPRTEKDEEREDRILSYVSEQLTRLQQKYRRSINTVNAELFRAMLRSRFERREKA